MFRLRYLIRITLVLLGAFHGSFHGSFQGVAYAQQPGVDPTRNRLAVDSNPVTRGVLAPSPGWINNFEFGEAEALLAQGQLSLDQNRYQDAQAAFAQALQVNRASQGLINLGQVQIIDQLLNSLLLQHDWREFDQQLDYMGWLHHRVLRDQPELLASGLINQSDWHRAAAAVIDDSKSAWYLIQAKYLNWQAVSVLEKAFGKHDVRLTPVLYRIVLDHYYQSVSNQRKGMTSFDYKTDGKVVANGWSLSKNENIRRSYQIGLENLQRIRAIYQSSYNEASLAARVADALIQVRLADWELLHGNEQVSLRHYQEAYYSLQDAGIAALEIELFFDQPVVLPALQLEVDWNPPAPSDSESSVSFVAWSSVYPGAQRPWGLDRGEAGTALPDFDKRATVQINLGVPGQLLPSGSTLNNQVTGINVVDYVPREEGLLERIFEEIPALQFRPKLVDGKLSIHDTVIMNYIFAGN